MNVRPGLTALAHPDGMRRTLGRALSMLMVCVLPAAANAVPYVFDSGDFLAESSAWEAWADMLTRHATQFDGLKGCLDDKAACTRRMRSLHVVLSQGTALPREKQIRLVNRYVNRKRYNEDRRKIIRNEEGKLTIPSHWATLVEFLEKGGDCEDFTTAKYLMLRHFGFAAEDMRVVVVYDRSQRAHHAVLAVRFDGETIWVLDTDNRIYRKRRPLGYRYVYAVNELGIWDHDIRLPRRRR